MQTLAQLMSGGFGTRVYYVQSGGVDTHANEKPAHDRLMSELSDAIAAFYQDIQAHGLSRNVALMTWSEFGRRVKENGSGGTDHGTAAPLFVIGDGVRGGLVDDPNHLIPPTGWLTFPTTVGDLCVNLSQIAYVQEDIETGPPR